MIIKENIKLINSNFEWKLVDSVTGQTAITLPITFNELLLHAKCTDGYPVTTVIPSVLVVEGFKPYWGCGRDSNSGYDVQAYALVSEGQISLQQFFKNATKMSTTATFEVYYR